VVSIAAFFSIHVCDQQLSSTGSVVRVCRHMQATDPPVLAAALVVLAALSVFFNEISGFGFTMKREVEKSVEKAEAAGQKAEAAGQTAEAAGQTAKAAHEIAVATTTNAEETAEDLLTLRHSVLPPVEAAGTYAEQAQTGHLLVLAQEYDTIRATLPSGAVRTSEMNKVARGMQSNAAKEEDFDVEGSLASPDGGLRLAAYIHLHQKPNPSLTKQLVASLIDVENTAFGRIYGLTALAKQVEKDATSLDQEDRQKLDERLRPRVAGDGPAITELEKILATPSQPA